MKTKNPYSIFDTYCLRTPTFAVSDYITIVNKEKLPPQFYKTLWKNKTFKEALYLASPYLFGEIEKVFINRSQPEIKQLELTILKYFARISSRCTPFGLFAGCNLGTFSEATSIALLEHKKYSRTTRFDMHFLTAFIKILLEDTSLKKSLKWFPNSSLYPVGDQNRYIEYTYKNKRRQHSIEAVTTSPYLSCILENATRGATISELAKTIISSETSKKEAISFIDILIENQILVSEVEPNITGVDYFENIEKVVAASPNAKKYTILFTGWKKTLLKLDSSLENNPIIYNDLFKSIKKVYAKADPKYLFQVDSFTKTAKNTLTKKNSYNLLRAMPFLNRINSAKNFNTTITKFKQAFIRRYETKEIPLAIALDTEIGIGFNQNKTTNDDTSFLDEFIIKPKQNIKRKIERSKWDSFLYKKIENLSFTDEKIIHLTDNDALNFPETWDDLPDTLSAMVEILTINNTETLYIETFGGSSAINLLGRFSSGDTSIKKFVASISNIEQQINNTKIVADILHLPEARLGNILQRASLSKYEIPYLANSLIDKNKQIAITDIMISVINNRIILKSKKHNKEIIPKLYNAHNYSGGNSLPIYHFLCEMQLDEKRSNLSFFWSEVFSLHSFLPRVVYKSIILSKARWRINSEKFINNVNSNDNKFIEEWITTHKIPKWISLVEGDNTLLLNLLNNECIDVLLDHAKKHKVFTLEEFLFTEDLIVKQGEKGFTNQCIISFYNKNKLNKAKQ